MKPSSLLHLFSGNHIVSLPNWANALVPLVPCIPCVTEGRKVESTIPLFLRFHGITYGDFNWRGGGKDKRLLII